MQAGRLLCGTVAFRAFHRPGHGLGFSAISNTLPGTASPPSLMGSSRTCTFRVQRSIIPLPVTRPCTLVAVPARLVSPLRLPAIPATHHVVRQWGLLRRHEGFKDGCGVCTLDGGGRSCGGGGGRCIPSCSSRRGGKCTPIRVPEFSVNTWPLLRQVYAHLFLARRARRFVFPVHSELWTCPHF